MKPKKNKDYLKKEGSQELTKKKVRSENNLYKFHLFIIFNLHSSHLTLEITTVYSRQKQKSQNYPILEHCG